jgi:hypothetical protein
MRIDWQEIEHNWPRDDGKTPCFRVGRAKVPGGWLVIFFELRVEEYWANMQQNFSGAWGAGFGGLTFVPDPSHRWDGNSLP